MLPWVTSRFASELSGALADENRKRLTPPTAAIKVGSLLLNLPLFRKPLVIMPFVFNYAISYRLLLFFISSLVKSNALSG